MLTALVNILLVLLVVFLVGYPLFRREEEQRFVAVKPGKTKNVDQKEIIMNTLGEIEFDYQMKKLSEEDYQLLKNTYSGAAVNLINNESGTQVKRQKSNKAVPVSNTQIEQEIEAELALLDKSAGTCHRCGAGLKEEEQEYCHACGERQY